MESIKRKPTDPIYTLGVASELSDTAIHSIRQYIEKGLIIPYKRENQRHLFSEVDIIRLKRIKKFINEQGLNFAGIKAMYSLIPCWIIKPCTEKDRSNCEAYNSSDLPCWEASNKGQNCKNSDCRICPVYRIPETCQDLNTLLKKLLP